MGTREVISVRLAYGGGGGGGGGDGELKYNQGRSLSGSKAIPRARREVSNEKARMETR